MKKRVFILLIAAMLLLLPGVASANSPVRHPWLVQVECRNMKAGVKIDAVLQKENGTERRLEDVYEAYRSASGGMIYLSFEDGETSFFLIRIDKNGETTQTETVQFVDFGQYQYDGSTNRLTSNGTYYSKAEGCANAAMILLFFPLLILVPCGLTLLIEWLAALCFRLRPVKYVFAINAITNPVMNILLLLSSLLLFYSRAAYWIILALMEIAVVFIEYLYYRKKYTVETRAKLLTFSITANVLSLLLGGLAQYFLF